jgi:hypothetical protein
MTNQTTSRCENCPCQTNCLCGAGCACPSTK